MEDLPKPEAILSDGDIARIRAEEMLRAELQKERSKAQAPRTARERFVNFFERTNTGSWVLTTVLASVVAVGTGWVKEKLDRSDLEVEFVFRLLPTITSEKPQIAALGVLLLDHLRDEKVLDTKVGRSMDRVAHQVAVGRPDVGLSIAAHIDAPVTGIYAAPDKGDAASLNKPKAPAIAALLPRRVYIVVPQRSTEREAQSQQQLQMGIAEKVSDRLRSSGFLVPATTLMPVRQMPTESEVRYFHDIDAQHAKNAAELISLSLNLVQRAVWGPKPKKYNGSTPPGQLEIWFTNATVQTGGE